ncbi:SelT/SelW/SelH family protein [Halomicrococcus sp. NG-SE-24]|uniref:SelT/SelW/SelH family protein n=1 Tax=Halomicrococcus sp. NG-SE-24 TaxID=3436928 RepID=UPI003D97912F
MTEVNIEYCVPCGLREYAIDAQEALLEEFGRGLDGVRLEPGHGGVFKVYVDGELVWDKDEHGGDVDFGTITDAVGQRARA